MFNEFYKYSWEYKLSGIIINLWDLSSFVVSTIGCSTAVIKLKVYAIVCYYRCFSSLSIISTNKSFGNYKLLLRFCQAGLKNSIKDISF